MAPPTSHDSDVTQAGVPVAEYVRMSTDHQKYSTAHQSSAIHEYAKAHHMEVVRTYQDDGKSGFVKTAMRRRCSVLRFSWFVHVRGCANRPQLTEGRLPHDRPLSAARVRV